MWPNVVNLFDVAYDIVGWVTMDGFSVLFKFIVLVAQMYTQVCRFDIS
jgi:hypothetical protein